ncbi:uracil-DNA glycosylase [Maricaulis parjimensis]|uniref:uracil-DNA glycosylase n=1 Tax=Maricaulis parjimensis TaxID=144023 RepID=UPI00193A4C4C|nr:uracil-DNA glycosylase [Maricaulis parjimensis]
MNPPAAPLDPKHEKALQALIAWWDEAGIELDAPVVRPRSAPAASPSRSAGAEPARHQASRATQSPAPAATAAAARAAGFGQTVQEGPSSLELAAKAQTLDELKSAIEAFEGCALKRTARNTVFARGDRAARVMVVGEAPGKEEDESGEPFVGPAGHLVDRMLASIGIERDTVYMSNILNWRPPGNRTPTQDEIALCLPFIERHVALKAPDILILAGGLAAQALLRETTGITRLRGRWQDYAIRGTDGEASGKTIPALPIFHPSYLLRRPPEKKSAWIDMLALQSRLSLED